MGQINTYRVQNPEERYTFTEPALDGVIKELDSRTSMADCYPVFTRTSGLISKIEYYKDAAHTLKKCERNFTRNTGTDGIEYIATITSIYYNDDTSEDSRVTTTLTRHVDDNYITQCDNVFSTSESECP
jgi:hypothetical protein